VRKHFNPAPTLSHLNTENVPTERLQVIKKLLTNDLTSDAQILMYKHKQYEKFNISTVTITNSNDVDEISHAEFKK
jgi:hypothetical protein